MLFSRSQLRPFESAHPRISVLGWLLYEGHAYYEKMCKLYSMRLHGLGVLTGMSVRTAHHNADASSDCGGSLTSTTTGTRNTDKLFVLPSALLPIHPPDDEAPVRYSPRPLVWPRLGP